jgi:hypothetical protein
MIHLACVLVAVAGWLLYYVERLREKPNALLREFWSDPRAFMARRYGKR